MKLPTLAWLHTLRGRLIGGLTVLVLGTIGASVIAIMTVQFTVREFADNLAAQQQWGDVTTKIEAGVLGMTAAGQAYLTGGHRGAGAPGAVGGSPVAAARFRDAGDATYREIRHLGGRRDLSTDDRILVGHLAEMEAQLEVGYAMAHAYFDLGKAAESGTAAAEVGGVVDRLTAGVYELTHRQAQHAQALQAQLERTRRTRDLPLLLLLVFSVAMGVGLAWVTVRGIEMPLGRLQDAAARIGNGDLRPIESEGMLAEFAVLAGAFSTMGERLRRIVGDVVQESERITESANGLSAVSEQLSASSQEITGSMMGISQGAASQAAHLGEARVGLRELAERTGELEAAAVRSTALGDDIQTIAQRHQRDVSETVVALLAVQDIVKTSAGEVAQLAQSSEAIDDFVRLVKRIAS